MSTHEQRYAAARKDLARFPQGLDSLTAWLSGAAWERDHLATQEPTDAEVEAAAKAIYLFEADYHTEESWEREKATYRVHYLTYARAALSAARAARRDEEKR